MDRTNIPTKLGELGLNSYETKLWVSLLSKGPLVVGELSDVADVPRSRSYDVLESLEKKGFVNIKEGKPVKCEAISPNLVIENTKKTIKQNLEKEDSFLNGLKTKELFFELEKLYKKNLNTPKQKYFFGSFKNKTNTKNQLQYMIKNSKKFVYIIESCNGLKSNIDFLTKTLPVLEGKGVKTKVMVNGVFSESAKSLKTKQTHLSGRLYVVDGEEMLFMLSGDKGAAVLVKTPNFIKSVVGLFEKQWESSSLIR